MQCKKKLQAALYRVIVQKDIYQVSITPPKLTYYLSASDLVVKPKEEGFIKIKLIQVKLSFTQKFLKCYRKGSQSANQKNFDQMRTRMYD